MEFTIPSNFKNIRQVSEKILQRISAKQHGASFLFDIKLACEEAMINAIKYGNKHNANKVVRITCEITKEAVVITVEDEGNGFDYKHLCDPTTDENLLKTGGRGLFLIRNVMDKFKFNAQGNKITMTKYFPKTKKDIL